MGQTDVDRSACLDFVFSPSLSPSPSTLTNVAQHTLTFPPSRLVRMQVYVRYVRMYAGNHVRILYIVLCASVLLYVCMFVCCMLGMYCTGCRYPTHRGRVSIRVHTTPHHNTRTKPSIIPDSGSGIQKYTHRDTNNFVIAYHL